MPPNTNINANTNSNTNINANANTNVVLEMVDRVAQEQIWSSQSKTLNYSVFLKKKKSLAKIQTELLNYCTMPVAVAVGQAIATNWQ